MKTRLFALPFFAALAWADGTWPNGLTVTFNGGTALEIHTESSLANSPLSTSGSVAISDRNLVSRTVVDKQGRMLFTYDIEAAPDGGSPARYTIRIKPHDPNQVNLYYLTFQPGDELSVAGTPYVVRADGKISGERFGEVQVSGLTLEKVAAAFKARTKERQMDIKVTSAKRDVPTVASVREFKSVRIGEAVSIDILFNPSTGERIFDVIQPITLTPAQVALKETAQLEDEFSFMKVRIAINGKTVEEPGNSWMIGGAMKIALPGRGTVYLAIKPVTSHPFQPVGRAEKGKLTFPLGTDFVEITSAENVMKKSSYRTIWVYWDPKAPNTHSVDLTCSGTIESLLPKND
jgi:hypothetical protein